MVEQVLSKDGTSIAVWRSGVGPPLVLVHGTTADHSRWAPVLPAFEERFTVLAMDRRGRGESGDSDDYTFEREFEDVAAVVGWAGRSVYLLGHSHGAVCALEGALLVDGVAKLILYEPPLGFVVAPKHTIQELEALLEAGKRDELLTVFFREVAGVPPEQIEQMRSMPAWKGRLAAAGTVSREERVNREYTFEPDRFRELRVPTLLLEGGDSPEPFKKADRALAAVLPDCRVAALAGQRHVAMDTATELFTKSVLSFLEEKSP
jgi:pimeloyl-ACP methyl ester carboxylesterase